MCLCVCVSVCRCVRPAPPAHTEGNVVASIHTAAASLCPVWQWARVWSGESVAGPRLSVTMAATMSCECVCVCVCV